MADEGTDTMEQEKALMLLQRESDLLTHIDEALETAAMALRAGVDWLEAGTPLLLAHGLRAVEALRAPPLIEVPGRRPARPLPARR